MHVLLKWLVDCRCITLHLLQVDTCAAKMSLSVTAITACGVNGPHVAVASMCFLFFYVATPNTISCLWHQCRHFMQ